MKVSELRQIIENVVSNEVRKTIVEEATGKKEVYHIKCEGIPLATFESEKEANDALPDYKEKHKGGELIIEKGVYNSNDDMLDKLDEMNDQLEETDNMKNTEMQPEEGNEFTGALKKAKDAGKDNFEVGGKEYEVEEGECDECGQTMEEDNDIFENILRGKRKHSYVAKDDVCDKCGKEVCECGEMMEDAKDGDPQYTHLPDEDQPVHEGKMCNECGGMIDEESGMCNECGSMMYESKKKRTIRLTETELTNLISKMVSESVPGLEAAKKAHKENGKENSDHITAVEKKIANSLKFDGNDNPEFPKAIGKGEKVARENTPKEEEEIKKNFAGLENLDYDIEPSEQFKKRLKMALEGDRLMGNAPTTEKTNIVPSNGSKLGEMPKDKDGNSIPTPETAKKIEKQVKDRQKDKDNRELYPKEKVPVTQTKINESKDTKSVILESEIEKMKKIFTYNKKTQ